MALGLPHSMISDAYFQSCTEPHSMLQMCPDHGGLPQGNMRMEV